MPRMVKKKKANLRVQPDDDVSDAIGSRCLCIIKLSLFDFKQS